VPTSGLSAWRLWGASLHPPSPDPRADAGGSEHEPHPPPPPPATASPFSVTLKRAPPPNPHLAERTKQRKLSHRFLRSESLLAPPPARALVPTATPTATPTGFLRVRTESDVLVTLALTGAARVPRPPPLLRPKRRLPAWWASVSRTFGDGLPSRLGPEEHVWVGDGRAWLPALGRSRGHPPQDEPFAVPVLGPAGAPRRHCQVGPAQDENQAPVAAADSDADTDAGAAKKQLLAVLRRRLAESGGPTRAGEAALRFRRWVIWNKHVKGAGGQAEAQADVVGAKRAAQEEEADEDEEDEEDEDVEDEEEEEEDNHEGPEDVDAEGEDVDPVELDKRLGARRLLPVSTGGPVRVLAGRGRDQPEAVSCQA